MSASRFMLRPLTRALLMHGAARSRLAATGLGMAMTLAVAPYVQAQEWTLNIPAQPLAQALQSLGQQTSLQIIYSPESLQGLRSTALNGRYADDSAIAAMLKGTGIRHQRDGNTVTLLGPATGSAMELAPTNINGQRLTATTEGSNSYTTGAVTIGKGEHSLKETPQSVTVMTRKLLDDQNLNTIEQVMEKTPGITVYDSPMGGKYFYSRGFRMTGQYQYDGVPLDMGNGYPQADSFSSDMAYYDRVEVLRGAAGMMKGSGGTAGAVNFVRKRGQSTPHTELTLSGGSYDNYRGQIDTGGPLNESGTLRGRAVIAEQTRQFFYDNADRKDQIYYGALDYDLTPDTTLGLGMAYEDVDARPCWGGLPRYKDGSDLKLSRSTCLGASWNTWRSKRTTYFTDLSHQFNENWALKVAGVYSRNTQDTQYAFSEGAVANNSANTTIPMYTGLFDYDQKDYGMDAYVDGKFEGFGQQHELIVGVNASRSNKDDFYSTAALKNTQDVFNPNRHIAKPDEAYYTTNSMRGGPVKSLTTQYGAYSTLRLKVADPLTVVLGSRVSWYKSDTDSYFLAWQSSENAKTKETGEVTPFAAVLYDLTDNLTAYASYSDIFTPQGNFKSEDGAALKPLVGENYELGIKGEWLDGRVNSSFNLFRTIQKDQAQTDYNSSCASSDGYCYVNAGKVRAQGFEAEVSGEVIDRLQLLAGYTYTQTKTLDDIDSTKSGAVFNSYVPRHLFRVWGDYALSGPLDRFTVGAGVNAQSDNYRESRTTKTTQAGYAVWNGRIGYRIDDTWSVALNGNNLFDKRYYTTIGTESFGNYYGDPRNFTMTLKANF